MGKYLIMYVLAALAIGSMIHSIRLVRCFYRFRREAVSLRGKVEVHSWKWRTLRVEARCEPEMKLFVDLVRSGNSDLARELPFVPLLGYPLIFAVSGVDFAVLLFAERLVAGLWLSGIVTIGGGTLFLLLQVHRVKAFLQRLASAGQWSRAAEELRDTRLRGIMRSFTR